MLWSVSVRRIPLRSGKTSFTRTFATATATTSRYSPQAVQRLKTWNLEEFRQKAFVPQFPAHLPRQTKTLGAAHRDWFTLDTTQNNGGPTQTFTLKQDFWSTYRDILVPLELTANHGNGTTFQQVRAPLGVFLRWIDQATNGSSQRLYLAQCQLADLPRSLRDGVPTPEIVQKTGKGDVYDANLWMGLAPTYTPLHRDPNPNLFLQLAGRKVVKLFPPGVGASIFAEAQEKLGRDASGIFRGEDMMQGPEKELLEKEVWSYKHDREGEFEATLEHDEALFIPLGWWHSIKGVGKGVTASVNWWFR